MTTKELDRRRTRSESRQTPLARRISTLSQQRWSQKEPVKLLGRDASFREAQKRMLQFSKIERPVLIRGESGVGKENFARGLYLLSDRSQSPFIGVNCAHFQSEAIAVSELFGHEEGSFTGAVKERKGIFEEADGGIVFLDEVADLPMRVQTLLLRVLSEGEIRSVGRSKTKSVDVRVIAATNKSLPQMVERGSFRLDLFYRLCYFQLPIPPLRDRGRDWKIIMDDYLGDLNHENDAEKSLSDASVEVLDDYDWPGNVRELFAIADVGYCLSAEESIEPEHFTHQLGILSSTPDLSSPPSPTLSPDDSEEAGVPSSANAPDPAQRSEDAPEVQSPETQPSDVPPPRGDGQPPPGASTDASTNTSPPPSKAQTSPEENSGAPSSGHTSQASSSPLVEPPDLRALYDRLTDGDANFWDAIREPYLNREYNRCQVRELVRLGLQETDGSYKHLVRLFGVDSEDYMKFMDFLRHHDLKPSDP